MTGWPARFCAACGGRLVAKRSLGPERRRCPRCGWTFYDNPLFASIAVIRRRGRLLLAKRARPPYAGMWDLPGGFVEAGETPESGMRRELREELGVGPRRLRLLSFATDHYGPNGVPVLTAIYQVTLTPGPITPADDISEVRWFPQGKIPLRAIAFASLRRALKAYLSGARKSDAGKRRRPIKRVQMLGGEGRGD